MNKKDVALLSQEIELLMQERAHLLRIVGAAAALVACTDVASLTENSLNIAEVLSELVNVLPEETLQEALGSIDAHLA